MSAPAITVRPQQAVVNAMRLMDERGVRCLPVVDGQGCLTGTVTRHDLVKVFVRPDADIAGEIEDDLRHFAWGDTSGIRVTVRDGVVTLGGRTRTHSDATLVTRAVIPVNGVVDVREELLWDEDDL